MISSHIVQVFHYVPFSSFPTTFYVVLEDSACVEQDLQVLQYSEKNLSVPGSKASVLLLDIY